MGTLIFLMAFNRVRGAQGQLGNALRLIASNAKQLRQFLLRLSSKKAIKSQSS